MNAWSFIVIHQRFIASVTTGYIKLGTFNDGPIAYMAHAIKGTYARKERKYGLLSFLYIYETTSHGVVYMQRNNADLGFAMFPIMYILK